MRPTVFYFTVLLAGQGWPVVYADTDIDEIQVTAARRVASLSDVAAGVTIVGSGELAIHDLVTDALAGRTGVFVQETTPGQGAVIVRGMKGSELVHMVDSMRINNAIFRNAPTQYVALVDPHIIDRVEVVRGSLSSLYGSDAMGGAANFITQQPLLDESGGHFQGDAILSGGSADKSRSLSVGAEAANSHAAVLARMSTFEAGNRQPGGSGPRTPFTAYTYDAARLALLLAPHAQRSWRLDLQYLQQPQTDRVDELIPGYGQTEPSSSEFSFEPNARSFVHARYEHVQGLWSADWALDLGWQRIDDDRITRGFNSGTRRLERNGSDLTSINVEAVRQSSGRQWVYGLTHNNDVVSSSRDEIDLTSGTKVSAAPRFPDASNVRQSGVYLRVQQDVAKRSNLAVGARLSKIDVNAPAALGVERVSIGLRDLSGDIGWTFAMRDEWQLLANLGRGFRAPNIFDIGNFGERPGNRFNIPNNDLAAETVLHFDAGIRKLGDWWRAELRGYVLRYENKIESVATGEFTVDGRQITQSQNLAAVDVDGVEFSLEADLSNVLQIAAILNFARGENRSHDMPATPADRIPPLNGRIDLRWQASDRWQMQSSLIMAASQQRLSPRDLDDPRINPDGTPGWLIVNLAADYAASDRLAVGIAANNLLDRLYRVHGSGLDARGTDLRVNLLYRW